MYRSIKTYSDEELIQAALDFADQNQHFNTSFIHALKATMLEYYGLTTTQRKALEYIIEKWNIL